MDVAGRRRVWLLAFALVGLTLLGCERDDLREPAPTPSPSLTQPAASSPTATLPATAPAATATPGTPQAADQATRAAIDALARWLGPVGDPASVSVRSAERVTWPNGCLGLARPGRVCTQALVEGYRIELQLGDASYEVRTDRNGSTVLWAPNIQILVRFAEASTNVLQFTTDDGGVIVAQAVFGTDFGVDVNSLDRGDTVGIGLAEAPQSGGFLLVWVDPTS